MRRDLGWWYFYLVALAVKTPLPLLVAGSAGLAWLAARAHGPRDTWALAPAVLVLTILLFASTFSRINIGIRHVLILYPFLALGAGYLTWRAWRWAVSRASPRSALLAEKRGARGDALAARDDLARLPRLPAVLQRGGAASRADTGRLGPRLGAGPEAPGMARGRAAHPASCTSPTAAPRSSAREPLPPFVVLPPRQPVSGWVAVSALARTRNPADYAWLNAYRPLERVGKTIDLYYIP